MSETPKKEDILKIINDFYKNFDENMAGGPAPGVNTGEAGADQPPAGAGLAGDDESGNILLDKLRGGSSMRFRNKALSAPLADVNKRVSLNRLAIQMRNEERAARMRMTTHAVYSNMEDERELRRLRSFRPAARTNTLKTKEEKQSVGIDNGDIPQFVGTAGMASNNIATPSAFKDPTLITGRGILGVTGNKAKPYFF